jgi:hypothetical protein
MEIKRLGYLVPVSVSILYFLTVKQVVPDIIYMIIGVLTALYYFPVKLLLFNNNFKESTVRTKVNVLSSNLLFSIILSFSILSIYLEDSENLSNFVGVFAIINFIALVYYYVTEKNSHYFIMHFCFLILISAIMFV